MVLGCFDYTAFFPKVQPAFCAISPLFVGFFQWELSGEEERKLLLIPKKTAKGLAGKGAME